MPSLALHRPLKPRIGVAVVGAGYWGSNLIRVLSASDQWDLRWIIDADLDLAQRSIPPALLGHTSAATDIGTALQDPNTEAVVIATPPSTHAWLAAAALDARRHVLAEKPLTTTLGEARALTRRAEEPALTLMCDHTYCYTPVVERIQSLLMDGTVGDVLFFHSTRVNLGAIQDDADVVWDLAPHDLSILDAIIPGGLNPVTVSAIGSDPIGTGRACLAYLTLHLPFGVLAHVHVNWLSPTKVRRILVGGSRRTLIWDDLNPSQRLLVCDRGVDRDSLGPERGDRIAYRVGDVSSPSLPEEEALVNVITEFHRSITTRNTPRTDGHAGVRVVRLLEAATASMAKGGMPITIGGDE